MQSIEWRPVVGYEGYYEVSSDGRVRSLLRVIMRANGHPQTIRARELKPFEFRGYRVVALSSSGHGKHVFVHRLVAFAFIGPGKNGEEVCHGDGTRTNNSVANLRWGTRSDNVQDALRHGTHANASKAYCKNGHEFTPENTRLAQTASGGDMRVCIACRKQKVTCILCGERRSYYGMKSHLKHAHKFDGGAQWGMALASISKK